MRLVSNRKSLKVFVVEDEEFFASLLQDYLQRNITEDVTVFSTGESCLWSLHLKPDVIIIDYYLNSVDKAAADGLEILRQLRNHGSHAHVIILSGQSEFGVAMQSRFDGAKHYVAKNDQAFERIASLIEADHRFQ